MLPAWFKGLSSCALEDGVDLPRCANGLEPNLESPELGEMFHDLLGLGDLKRTAAELEVMQGERTVAVTLIAHHLDVRHIRFARVLLTQQLAQAAIARLVVDRVHKQLGFSLVVGNREEPEIAHQFRRQELANERLVLEIAHGEIKGFAPARAGDVRKPPPIFRLLAGRYP